MSLAPYTTVISFVQKFEQENSIQIVRSGLFDICPELPNPHPDVVGKWPEKWPLETKSKGVYLFFDGESDPRLVYVGKSERPTSTIYSRLCDYFDWTCDEYTSHKRMVLREEWHGKRRPWSVKPRYFLAASMKPDSADGRCRIADTLETALIREALRVFVWVKKSRRIPKRRFSGVGR